MQEKDREGACQPTAQEPGTRASAACPGTGPHFQDHSPDTGLADPVPHQLLSQPALSSGSKGVTEQMAPSTVAMPEEVPECPPQITRKTVHVNFSGGKVCQLESHIKATGLKLRNNLFRSVVSPLRN